jgi:hypothetical protein
LHGPLFVSLPGLIKGEAAAPEARKWLRQWPPCPENFVAQITLIDYTIFLKFVGNRLSLSSKFANNLLLQESQDLH